MTTSELPRKIFAAPLAHQPLPAGERAGAAAAAALAQAQDLGWVLGTVGCKLFARERSFLQYVAWAVRIRLFQVIESSGRANLADVVSRTELNEGGADALLGVLCSLQLIVRDEAGYYWLSEPARKYFVRSSPFFVGDELHAPQRSVPWFYLDRPRRFTHKLAIKALFLRPTFRYGSMRRLTNQHVRNLPACTAAVETNEFDDVRCLVDLAGGSGAFAIPLAKRYPGMRIVLAELPQALKNVRRFLARQGFERRIEVAGVDIFEPLWDIPKCDGIFVGNLLHGFGDDTCGMICRKSFERLEPGGKIWVHEMLWNANKDGPPITALWNAAMRVGGGKQRTAGELLAIVRDAGFSKARVVRTTTSFSLVAAEKL